MNATTEDTAITVLAEVSERLQFVARRNAWLLRESIAQLVKDATETFTVTDEAVEEHDLEHLFKVSASLDRLFDNVARVRQQADLLCGHLHAYNELASIEDRVFGVWFE